MSSSSRPVFVSDVMTSDVCSADREQGLYEIWLLFSHERCHHIPIVEKGRPIGIVSTHDLIRVARKHGAERLSEILRGSETAGDVMSTNLETIAMNESVDIAIDRIGRGDIHSLLVVDDDENLVGIVTNHDLLDYLID